MSTASVGESFFVTHSHQTQQDSSVRSKPQQGPTLQLSAPAFRPQLDLERAQEVIERVERREQQARQRQIRTSRINEPEQVTIHADSLLRKYSHIKSIRPIDYPDTLSLTILERYYYMPSSPGASGEARPLLPVINVSGAIEPTDTIITTIAVPPGGMSGTLRGTTYPSVITSFLIVSLLLASWIKLNFGQNIIHSFYAVFNYLQSCRNFEERRESDRYASLYSNILFLFNIGIFLAISSPVIGINLFWGNYGLTALLFSVTIGLLYLIKAGGWRVTGSIFMIQDFSQQYIFNMYLYNRNLGLFLLPFILTIPYISEHVSAYFVWAGIGLIGICYLLRCFRIFQIIHVRNVPNFYFILYLCTLEILPLLLCLKAYKILGMFLIM